MVADHAAKAGATVWEHTEAVEPIMEGDALRGRSWWPRAKTAIAAG